MPDVAEQNYNELNKNAQAMADTVTKILLALMDYLEMEAKFAPQKEFAKWIREGGECCFYNIQGSCKNELKNELIKNQIPYIELSNDPDKLIIKYPDLEAIKELNRGIMISKNNYFQEVDSVEMEDAIFRFDKATDKTIFTLHNLTAEETECLKNKCNDISRGFMVGTNKEDDDKYSISILGSKVMDCSQTGKIDFCKAALSATLSLYGGNSKTKMDQIDFDLKFDEAIDKYKGSNEVKYIVGTNERKNKNYIEINSQGFIAYKASITPEGGVVEKVVGRCDINDINYDTELKRHLDVMKDKTVLHNIGDLNTHLASMDSEITSGRAVRSEQEEYIAKVEKEIVNTIDKMIKSEIVNKDITFNSPEESFNYYINNAREALAAVFNDEKTRFPKPVIENMKAMKDDIIGLTGDYGSRILTHTNEMTQNIESHKARRSSKAVVKEEREEHGFTNR